MYEERAIYKSSIKMLKKRSNETDLGNFVTKLYKGISKTSFTIIFIMVSFLK